MGNDSPQQDRIDELELRVSQLENTAHEANTYFQAKNREQQEHLDSYDETLKALRKEVTQLRVEIQRLHQKINVNRKEKRDIIDAIDSLDVVLENIQPQVSDSEISFQLRATRQSLQVLKERHKAGEDVIEQTDLEEILDSLHQLKYLDT